MADRAASSDRRPTAAAGGLVEAKSLAAGLPDLLVEARRAAANVIAGWHGRRRAGPGETFWQFRPFADGEPAIRIDWRRSARDDHLYVREREWEAAHTLWLTADLSASMAFRSQLGQAAKRDRAIVLLLALAEIAARGGERVGMLGVAAPIASRQAAERLATALAHAVGDGVVPAAFPETTRVGRFCDVVAIGDLLDPIAESTAWIRQLAGRGVRGHLVQVLDPVEETFPFGGRTEFQDPESGVRIVAGRAERWAGAYRLRFLAHREALRDVARRVGWSFQVHHTDRPASEALIGLRAVLTGAGGPGGVAA